MSRFTKHITGDCSSELWVLVSLGSPMYLALVEVHSVSKTRHDLQDNHRRQGAWQADKRGAFHLFPVGVIFVVDVRALL